MGPADGANYRSLRHWAGFAISGGTAFIVDAALTSGLVQFAGLDRFTGRLVAIACAMAVAWLMHRRFTFRVAAPPSLAEFGRFASVAMTANLINYGVYALIVLLWPTVLPFLAVTMSTAVAMVVSYLGFRFRVFRDPRL